MSFDIKYDKNGDVINPKQEPQFVEPVVQQAAAPAQEEQSAPEVQVESGLEAIAQDVAPVVEVQEVQEIQEPVAPTTPRMDKRLKVLMDKAARMEQERNEAMQRLQRLEEEAKSKWRAETQFTQSESIDEEINLAPDELAEGKHLKAMQAKMRKMEDALRAQQQQSATVQAQALLKARHPDFDKIVSAENVAVLKELHPEIYQTLSSNNDLYTTGSSAYTIIKNLGIHVEDVYEQDRAKIQKNVAKPKALATISPQRAESPLSQANAFAQGLTPALQKQLMEEMQAARRGL